MALLPYLITQNAKREVLAVYMTDGISAVAENTMRFAGGMHLQSRYIDLISMGTADKKTGDEIVSDVVKKAGLMRKGGNE